MAGIKLKSYEFRREREVSWRQLETLVAEAEAHGIKSLSSVALLRLPGLYRATVSSLSVARGISLDQNVLDYLESLATRAYFIVYGARGSLTDGVAAFFTGRFPRAVRAAKWHLLMAGLVMFLGIAAGFFLSLGNEDWVYTLLPDHIAEGRSPTSSTEDLRAVLYDTGGGSSEMLADFATFLFTHNAAIGMLCFALGFALGVPVILLMFYNGLIIGALAAVYESRGLSIEFWAWISVHGTTELLALVLCAGAGLMLGASLAFPGKYSRMDNLARNGRMASQIVMGAVVLFLVAGLLEGFARQLIYQPMERYLVGAGAAVWWALYFLHVGKDEGHGDGG